MTQNLLETLNSTLKVLTFQLSNVRELETLPLHHRPNPNPKNPYQSSNLLTLSTNYLREHSHKGEQCATNIFGVSSEIQLLTRQHVNRLLGVLLFSLVVVW